MNEKIKFETLEDVVAYVLADHYRAEQRWSLKDHTTKVWVDPVAGETWDAENDAIEYVYVSMSDPNRAEYDQRCEEIFSRMPEQKNVVDWTLRNRHWKSISLSPELGEMFCSVWKTAPAYRDATYTKRIGLMTLPGLLKRLGNTGISKQVADARKSAEQKQKMNGRNYARREVAKLAKQIGALMAKQPEIAWPTQIDELAKMDEMQES